MFYHFAKPQRSRHCQTQATLRDLDCAELLLLYIPGKGGNRVRIWTPRIRVSGLVAGPDLLALGMPSLGIDKVGLPTRGGRLIVLRPAILSAGGTAPSGKFDPK